MEAIKISEDFRRDPQGKEDGAIFRDIFIMPKLVRSNGKKIIIDFNDCFGFATSFIEEVFGGMIRCYGYNKKTILDRIVIISDDDESIPSMIEKYLDKAEKER